MAAIKRFFSRCCSCCRTEEPEEKGVELTNLMNSTNQDSNMQFSQPVLSDSFAATVLQNHSITSSPPPSPRNGNGDPGSPGGLGKKRRSVSFAPKAYDIRKRSMSTGKGIIKSPESSPGLPPVNPHEDETL